MQTLTYEFIVPSQILLVDPGEWPSLAVVRAGLRMQLRKPLAGQKLVKVDQTIGNEGVVVEYSIMRVDVDLEEGRQPPEWYVPFQIVRECLLWIRVAGRQYWLGALTSGTDSTTRGSVIIWSGKDYTYTNFGAARTPIYTPPLTKEQWEAIGREVTAGNTPSIPEVLFGDALISFRGGDYLQTVIRLGVISELELTAFIEDLLPGQSDAVRKLYASGRYQFKWKLNNMPKILCGEGYEKHNARFANELIKLYDLRGVAVHRAALVVEDLDTSTGKKITAPLDFGRASTFVFAVDDFLGWTKAHRSRLGIRKSQVIESPIKYTIGA